MRRLPLLALALAVAGCSSTGERAYYRTRSIPSDVDSTYGSVERARWRGDATVYELPAAPPSLGEEHVARRGCVPPGPQFKADPIVGRHDTRPGAGEPEDVRVGGIDDLGRTRGPDTIAADPAGALADERPAGPGFPATWQPVGGWDRRPPVKQGPDALPGVAVGGMRDQEKTDYCLSDPLPPAPTALRTGPAPAAKR